MARGEFREGIDVKYISHIFPTLISGTMDYCLKNSKDDNQIGLSGISDEILEKVDLVIEFLKNGIGHK